MSSSINKRGEITLTRGDSFMVQVGIKKDESIVLKSPNGTKYKIAVDDSGNITTTAI